MPRTYKATLNGNQLEWNGEVPDEVKNQETISVMVTILDEKPNAENLRPFGLSANSFVVPEDFDAPLPDEILNDFEN